MEITNKGGTDNKPRGDPGPLLRPVPLPVHQVLDPPATTAGRQELPDRINWTAADEPGGWRGPGRRAELAGESRFDMTNMKCGMDTHGPGETQTDRDRINNLGYGEGADEPGGELARLHPERQMLGRKPDLLTRGVSRSRRPLFVRRGLICGGLPQEVLASSLPGPLTAANQRQGRWDRAIRVCGRKERVGDHVLHETEKSQMMQRVRSYEQVPPRPVVMTRCPGVATQ